jgi:phosphoglycerate dehydrogenase-like enzyme
MARRLKWIHSTAVGVARLLPAPMVTSDVVVTNSRGVHSDAIAEHAIALVLALRRRLHTAAARQHDRVWAQVELAAARTAPLADTTLVVVGLGTIGTRIAALAAGLGMRVIGASATALRRAGGRGRRPAGGAAARRAGGGGCGRAGDSAHARQSVSSVTTNWR